MTGAYQDPEVAALREAAAFAQLLAYVSEGASRRVSIELGRKIGPAVQVKITGHRFTAGEEGERAVASYSFEVEAATIERAWDRLRKEIEELGRS